MAAPDEDGGDEEVVLDKRGLPPISRIKMPDGANITSTKIRWLSGVGYEPREIAPFLGVRYQQVRNVLTNPPKRASREDVPPLVVEIVSLADDDLEHMDKYWFDREMEAHRGESRKTQRATNAARRKLRKQEQEQNNEDLDREDYEGREE